MDSNDGLQRILMKEISFQKVPSEDIKNLPLHAIKLFIGKRTEPLSMANLEDPQLIFQMKKDSGSGRNFSIDKWTKRLYRTMKLFQFPFNSTLFSSIWCTVDRHAVNRSRTDRGRPCTKDHDYHLIELDWEWDWKWSWKWMKRIEWSLNGLK